MEIFLRDGAECGQNAEPRFPGTAPDAIADLGEKPLPEYARAWVLVEDRVERFALVADLGGGDVERLRERIGERGVERVVIVPVGKARHPTPPAPVSRDPTRRRARRASRATQKN